MSAEELDVHADSSFGCCTSRTRGLLRADMISTRSAPELLVPLMLYVRRRRGVRRHAGFESIRKRPAGPAAGPRAIGACHRDGLKSLARASDAVVSVHQGRRTRPDLRAAQRTMRRQTPPDRTASI